MLEKRFQNGKLHAASLNWSDCTSLIKTQGSTNANALTVKVLYHFMVGPTQLRRGSEIMCDCLHPRHGFNTHFGGANSAPRPLIG